MTSRTVFDHRGTRVRQSRSRTYLSLLDTFSTSCRVLARATPDRVDRLVADWVRRCFRISRTSLVAEGLEHLEGVPAGVIVSNHASLLDIPAILGTFPGRVRFVAKQELRSVPMFGRAMEQAGIVFVDRSDRSRAIQQLDAARALVAGGTSVWVAAEGTRSRAAGGPGPFKKGGFHVALDLGVPILPAWIEGTGVTLPPDGFTCLTGQTVTVRYGAPIPTAGSDLGAIIAETRQRIEGLRARETA